jgi:hypothetical protein
VIALSSNAPPNSRTAERNGYTFTFANMWLPVLVERG